MLLKLMISKGSYKSKEASINHIAAIKSNKSSNCSINEVTIKELGEYLLAGHMIVPSILEENQPLRNEFFTGTQIFGLDFDNEEVSILNDQKIKVRARDDLYLTSDTILNTCKAYGINPFMIYETYSSTDEWRRYRLLFAIKNIITDITYRKEVLEALITIFSVDGISTVDTACTDPSRVFFGAKAIVYEDESYFDELKAIEVATLINENNKKRNGVKDLKTSNYNALIAEGFSAHTYLNNKKHIRYVCTKNIELIKDWNCNGLRTVLRAEKKEFCTLNQCIHYITHELNMSEFLGIANSKSFSCIFHCDSAPSAGIIQLEDGQYYYKCFSSNCGFKGNLITVTAQLLGSSRVEAIKFIMKACNLNVLEPQWAKDYREELQENIRMIFDNEIKEVFPILNSVVGRYNNNLILILEYALQHILYKDDDGNVIFFISQNKLATILNTEQSSVCRRLALFALLKLIDKVDDDHVPLFLRKKSKEISESNNKKDTVQYYCIHSFTWSNLSKCNSRVLLYKEKHCTMKGMSREMIYRSFGEEIADGIYPKRKNIELTDESEKFKNRYEKWLLKLIAEDGYTTEKKALSKLKGYKTFNEIHAKRVLCQVLECNMLQRVRANKELKQKYSIVSKGYPFIIVAMQ